MFRPRMPKDDDGDQYLAMTPSFTNALLSSDYFFKKGF